MKKYLIALTVLLTIALSGCGTLKSEKQLLKIAENDYGSATLVSTDKSEKSVVLYLQDDEYGFDYRIKSELKDNLFDGTKFGSSEYTSCDFAEMYLKFILDAEASGVSLIEKSYNANIVTFDDYSSEMAAAIYFKDSGVNYIEATCKLAEIFKKYDMRGFLKNSVIYAKDEYGNHLGTAKVSDASWQTPEDESIEYFTWHAQKKNKNAVFLRKEQKPFSFAGIPLSRVQIVLGSYHPTSMDDLVDYYFFEADGKEFYVADFVDDETSSMYTNYDNP